MVIAAAATDEIYFEAYTEVLENPLERVFLKVPSLYSVPTYTLMTIAINIIRFPSEKIMQWTS